MLYHWILVTSVKGTLMREYRQLTEEDRIEIYAMKQAGKEDLLFHCCDGLGNSSLNVSFKDGRCGKFTIKQIIPT